jgi:hypothetical protein
VKTIRLPCAHSTCCGSGVKQVCLALRTALGRRYYAVSAGVRDVDGFARQWQILMLGSIVAAYAGDRDAARRAKTLGLRFIAAETASRASVSRRK